MAFAKGDQVVQVVTPIRGTVSGFQVDQETGEVLVKVDWSNDDGEHSRFFKPEEITPDASGTPTAK